MSHLIDKLCEFYTDFNPDLLDNLEAIYTPDVQFLDPLHEIHGINNLHRYFANMMEGLNECRFEFYQRMVMPLQQESIVLWTMSYRHRRLAGGKLLTITGNSHLRYSDRIFYHRDYFDAGSMLYEHLPLMGFAIRQIRKRLAVS